MGILLSAACSNCQYHRDHIKSGLGFSYGIYQNFYAPAYCPRCQEIQEVELKNKAETDRVPKQDHRCLSCGSKLVFYHAPFNRGIPLLSFEEVSDINYTRSPYDCPACGENDLTFEEEGLWD